MASSCRLFPSFRIRIAAACIILGSAIQLFSNQTSETSIERQIYLQTYSPGQGLEAMFGHSALRITDLENSRDSIYNFGAYDFEDPLFFFRILTGKDLLFSLSVRPAEEVMKEYLEAGRSVKEQFLNLDRTQCSRLMEYLQSEARPENREYRYDFLKQNCSTRIRDLLESITGGSLQVSFSSGPETGVSETDNDVSPDSVIRTLREHLHEYLEDHPWTRLGIDMVLNGGMDTPAEVREAAYLPEGLYEWAARSMVKGNAGYQPFVLSERIAYPPVTTVTTESSLLFMLRPVFVFSLLSILYGAVILLCISQGRRCRPLPLVALLHSGLVGSFLMVVQSGSGWGHFNWNLLLMYPTDLVAAAAFIAAPRARTLRFYALSTAGLSLLVLLAMPIIPQYINPALIPLVLTQAAGKAYMAYQYGVQRLY